MPTIVVIDPSNVTIDGEPAGCVLDVVENHKAIAGIRSLVLDALKAWHDGCRQCEADNLAKLGATHAAELAARDAAHQAAIDQLKAGHAAELADRDEATKAAVLAETTRLGDLMAKQDKTISDQQAQIDALGGTELGRQLACEARRKALLEAKAKAEAELAALGGEGRS